MFRPDDPLKPRDPAFDEAWHAQVLALADTFVRDGRITAAEWAETLGAELSRAKTARKPDTTDTYYHAALAALERLTTTKTDMTGDDLARRKAEWVHAYQHTPHGQPVLLTTRQNTAKS